MNNWKKPNKEMPTKGIPIEWTDSSGTIIKGTFEGVWMMESGVYIYYTPQKWRYRHCCHANWSQARKR